MLERLEAAGFQEILPPTFEYAEVFVRAGGGAADVADRLIRFLDLDGKLLALRYDFTASVARLAATKLADWPIPLRLSYAGKVFRQDPEREGRRREMLQVGGELLGEGGVAADVEVLRLALALVGSAGAAEFQVNLGHVGALAPALAALAPDERAAVRRLIDRKDAAGLAAVAPGALTELPFIIGRREALDRAARVMATGPAPNDAIARLHAIDAALSEPAATRKLLVPSSDGTLSVLFVKPADVPVYVESGAADVGITGTDVLRETAADVLEPLALGFGRCRMVVASPTQIPYPALPGGVTPRVATKYPRLTRAFFAETGQGVEVITVSGSVEVAPLLGLSHWIVDLVDTGRTLRENGLVERAPILDVGAVVVVNRASQKLRLEEHQRLLQALHDATT